MIRGISRRILLSRRWKSTDHLLVTLAITLLPYVMLQTEAQLDIKTSFCQIMVRRNKVLLKTSGMVVTLIPTTLTSIAPVPLILVPSHLPLIPPGLVLPLSTGLGIIPYLANLWALRNRPAPPFDRREPTPLSLAGQLIEKLLVGTKTAVVLLHPTNVIGSANVTDGQGIAGSSLLHSSSANTLPLQDTACRAQLNRHLVRAEDIGNRNHQLPLPPLISRTDPRPLRHLNMQTGDMTLGMTCGIEIETTKQNVPNRAHILLLQKIHATSCDSLSLSCLVLVVRNRLIRAEVWTLKIVDDALPGTTRNRKFSLNPNHSNRSLCPFPPRVLHRSCRMPMHEKNEGAGMAANVRMMAVRRPRNPNNSNAATSK